MLRDNIVIANSSNLAGHVQIGDSAILAGYSAVHQFTHIGAHAFVGLRSTVTQDILPFVLYADGGPRAINVEGIKRRGFNSDEIRMLRRAYKTVYRQGLNVEDALKELDKDAGSEHILRMINFIKRSERGIAR